MQCYQELREATDEELARQGQAGDERALALLFYRYRTRVFRFVRFRGADDLLAEEVTSQTLETMIRKLDQFQGRSSLSTWVLAIARGCLYHARADAKSDPETATLDECYAIPGCAVLEPAEITRREEQLRTCRKMLEKLTPEQQETVQLVVLEDMTWAEVAQLQNRSVDAVGMTLTRALRRLRALHQEAKEDPGLPGFKHKGTAGEKSQ